MLASRRLAAVAWLVACAVVVSPADAAGRALRPATAAAVQSNPAYTDWLAALAGVEAARAGTGASDCATTEALEPALREASARRAALLQSLAERGYGKAAPPPGVAPWPWGAVPQAPTFAAAVLDSSDVSLLHDTGTITYLNREFRFEVDPVFAANAFYAAHDDEYDMLVLFTTFETVLAGGGFRAYYLAVANDVTGLGYTHLRSNELFDFSDNYTGPAPGDRFQGFLHMNRIGAFPAEPQAPYTALYTPLELLGHEIGHRWLARIWLEVPGLGQEPVLLGRQGSHWSFIAHTAGSPLEGNHWEPLHVGRRWTSIAAPIVYSPLDLYLMGMLGAGDVDPASLYYLDDVESIEPPVDQWGNPWWVGSDPTPDVSCDATAVPFTIDDVTLANGYRLPAYPQSRRDLRVAFVLVWNTQSPVAPGDFAKLQALRSAFEPWFHDATQARGRIDSRLASLPARIVFQHRPRGDVEDSSRPIEIATDIRLEPRSLPTRMEDVGVTLVWSADGGAFIETPMTAAGDGRFAAEIPPQALGTTVRYFLRAATPVPESVTRWPEADGALLSFRIAADGQGPTVQHAPRTRWSRLAEPPLLRAVVRDAHGVAGVRVEHRVAGGPMQSTPMTAQGVSDVWEARPAFPGRLGQVVEYRIVARDVAASAHETALPASGFFTLEWERTLVENAEAEDPMWTHRSLLFGRLDQWHREIVNPIEGLYSWKVGPALNTVGGQISRPQDSVLESPAITIYPGGFLQFTHRYDFLRHEFTQDEAWDGGLVQWQDVARDGPIDRWYLIDPDDGYPFHIFSYDTSSALRGLPAYSGYQALPVEQTFTFAPWHWNRTVRFRFRVSASPHPYRAARDGWYIDAIRIDPGPPPTVVALSGLAAERRDGGVRLSWRADAVEPGDAFRIARAAAGSGGAPAEFAELAILAADPADADYAFLDATAPVGELAYRVGLATPDGDRAALEVHVAVPARFALHPAAPNPFNPATWIAFELAQAGDARLEIFDVSGRRVRTLTDATLAAGPHRVRWDGRDDSARPAASGIYWVRLQSGGREAAERLVLVR